MKLVYTHENRLMVLNVKNILSNHGIEVVVNKEYASSAAGGFSAYRYMARSMDSK